VSPQTTQVGDHLFSFVAWVGQGNGGQYPTYDAMLKFPATTCRSLTLSFAVKSVEDGPGDEGYLRVVQSTLDPVQASVPVGNVNTLTAPLSGGPWYLDESDTNPGTWGFNGDLLYVNGYGSCWSENGQYT